MKERKGDKFTEREKIEADNFVYVRENGSAWHLYRKDDLMTASSEAGSISTGCRQLTVEEDYLENFPVKLYEEIKIKTSENILKFTEQRDWINDDGMLLKIETVEGLFHPRIETSRSVFNYEYNPADLKIEAPIK
ncbi:MAG TPA: hypothetical protein PKY59_15325 [Pyrinomonadaceae bacterium]|nr:hypothetical protein [Pyrinomonadaceae bacterium]